MKEHHQNQMKLSQLRILVAVADLSNFSEAASQLEISQSAVSHAIATLEEHLGVVLFLRGRHGSRMTAVGECIVEHAREVVHRVDEIIKAAELSRGLKGGQVRIASVRSISTHILPTVITRFHQRFPAISVNLTEQEDYIYVENALQDGRADVGFIFLPTGNDFEVHELLRDDYIALLPPDFHPAQPQITWPELMTQPLIMPPAETMTTRQVNAHTTRFGYPLQVTYEVATDATIVNLVAQGLGATILPRLATEPIPPQVQVYPLPDPLERVIGVAVLANALHPPAVYAFLEILSEIALPAKPAPLTPWPDE